MHEARIYKRVLELTLKDLGAIASSAPFGTQSLFREGEAQFPHFGCPWSVNIFGRLFTFTCIDLYETLLRTVRSVLKGEGFSPVPLRRDFLILNAIYPSALARSNRDARQSRY